MKNSWKVANNGGMNIDKLASSDTYLNVLFYLCIWKRNVFHVPYVLPKVVGDLVVGRRKRTKRFQLTFRTRRQPLPLLPTLPLTGISTFGRGHTR
ncbi:hypothetical protein LINPERPRIM_LOCUS21161, partial [Linum perenne]